MTPQFQISLICEGDHDFPTKTSGTVPGRALPITGIIFFWA
jgi:hypothetical protein